MTVQAGALRAVALVHVRFDEALLTTSRCGMQCTRDALFAGAALLRLYITCGRHVCASGSQLLVLASGPTCSASRALAGRARAQRAIEPAGRH